MKNFTCLRECSGEGFKKHLAENTTGILLENVLGVWFKENLAKHLVKYFSQCLRECSGEFLKRCLVENASGNPFTNVLENASRIALGMLHRMLHRLLNFQWLSFLLFWETSWSINKRKAGEISQEGAFRKYCKFCKHLAISGAYFEEYNITQG